MELKAAANEDNNRWYLDGVIICRVVAPEASV